MNQILMVDNKKGKSNSGPIEIVKIIRFFTIALIVFGIFFIGQGSYAIYKDAKGKNVKNIPTVQVARVNDTALIKVNSINKITNLKYKWNNGEETVVPVDDKYIEETVMLPVENSMLNIAVEEDTGRVVKYNKQFNIEGIDLTEPTIEITNESTDGNIKIIATDETSIAYITYKINDEAQVKIEKSGLEDKTINYILKLPKGENNVVITATDEAGNTQTEEKKILVSGKTSMDLKIENGKLAITVEDPDGIKDLEINLNGVVYAKKDINQKGVKAALDLVEGVNTVRITVTNVNSLVTVGAKEFNYAQ